ncbi:unnamed protein product [Ambrosiozyma monospora]|uniref:Unnamed protein product n=1 Tax=Ambrosiozyma monospora TaxID=43982 RepID=A0ACB5TUU1_AMBMO|nr:unnamed protein product [Ambrosiozyma monospora]
MGRLLQPLLSLEPPNKHNIYTPTQNKVKGELLLTFKDEEKYFASIEVGLKGDVRIRHSSTIYTSKLAPSHSIATRVPTSLLQSLNSSGVTEGTESINSDVLFDATISNKSTRSSDSHSVASQSVPPPGTAQEDSNGSGLNKTPSLSTPEPTTTTTTSSSHQPELKPNAKLEAKNARAIAKAAKKLEGKPVQLRHTTVSVLFNQSTKPFNAMDRYSVPWSTMPRNYVLVCPVDFEFPAQHMFLPSSVNSLGVALAKGGQNDGKEMANVTVSSKVGQMSLLVMGNLLGRVMRMWR